MNTMDNYLIPVIPFHEQILTRGEGSFVYDTKGDILGAHYDCMISYTDQRFLKMSSFPLGRCSLLQGIQLG